MEKYKIDYLPEFDTFVCLVLVDPRQDRWAGGEGFSKDEIHEIMATADRLGYEFMGYTDTATKAMG